MGRRTNVYVSLDAPAASLPTPNATVQQITVEIRAFWPPGMGHTDTVRRMLDEAHAAAVADTFVKEPAVPVDWTIADIAQFIEVRTVDEGWSAAVLNDGRVVNRWKAGDPRYLPTEEYLARRAGGRWVSG